MPSKWAINTFLVSLSIAALFTTLWLYVGYAAITVE